jgi:hypothetical protein
MVNPAFFGLKLLGWTAAGMALAVGWKLGCYLVDMAMGGPESGHWFERAEGEKESKEEPLWKRKFSRVSE